MITDKSSGSVLLKPKRQRVWCEYCRLDYENETAYRRHCDSIKHQNKCREYFESYIQT